MPQPLGYTIVGGLLLSQLLTFYTTPVVYLYLDRLSRSLRRAPKDSRDAYPASRSMAASANDRPD